MLKISLPIFFELTLQCPLSAPTGVPSSHNDSPHSTTSSTERVDWSRVTSKDAKDFCCFLHNHLPAFPDDLVECCDPNCEVHFQLLDTLCSQILDCLQRGSCSCLPKVRKHRHLIPGWNARAHSLKQSAVFWHKVWSQSGCPSAGVLFQIKKNAKKGFKYKVHQLRRQHEHIKQEQLGAALSQSRQRDLFETLLSLVKVRHPLHLMWIIIPVMLKLLTS